MVNLFEIQTDYRYLFLFLLALVPLVLAFHGERLRRGWALVLIGNLLLLLTLVLPANAASQLLASAPELFEEGTRISSPRVFASSAMAIALLGSYMVLFGGLLDLQLEGVARWQRLAAGTTGLIIILVLLLRGHFDIYSVMVEFEQRGDMLGQRFTEHFVYVLVSLVAGLFIGIMLGLWASRDEAAGSVILYVVGIIQTIPSLALFGVLLVPLARLGDQSLPDVLSFFLVSLIGAGLFFFLVTRFLKHIPAPARPPIMILSVVLLLVPLSLFAVILITFGFRVVLNLFRSDLQTAFLILVAGTVILSPLWRRLVGRLAFVKSMHWVGQMLIRYLIPILAIIGTGYLLWESGDQLLRSRPLNELSIRDLGVSGIGAAPAIIALTLYSLLPLVRNTYAGLNNVDPAIVDAGRGMGMTPAQIFFQIELPLAFPVIMAGVRNAGIALVGIAAVASIIGAGALGDFILLGVNSTSVDLILLGAIPAIGLAILLDGLLQFTERMLTSPGIRQ